MCGFPNAFRFVFRISELFLRTFLDYLRTFLRTFLRITKGFHRTLLFPPNFSTELSSFSRYFSRVLFTLFKGLDCPYLRVFGGPIPDGQTYSEVLNRDIEGYREAIQIAASYGVQLLFETHDDFSTSSSLLPLLEGVEGEAGVIWDILHPYRFGESMEYTCQTLLPYIRHVHIKDSADYSKSGFDIVLPGEGTVPVRQAVSLLKNAGYNQYLCFEWEKHWHPEIQDADTALPHFMEYMKGIL